ncbi:MAG: hypothetical protein EA390_13830 [Balneolaceae bacterium]|nr:MAG: hypothetical protein EA390_13830 [Balneolaceae bacterium]
MGLMITYFTFEPKLLFMNILYPPDYQHGLIYLLIILFLVALTFILARKMNGPDQKFYRRRKVLINGLLILIILSTIYFFALPAYI